MCAFLGRTAKSTEAFLSHLVVFAVIVVAVDTTTSSAQKCQILHAFVT